MGKPRKVKKAFYLAEKQKEKKKKNSILRENVQKNISGQHTIFTDEKIISMGSYIPD